MEGFGGAEELCLIAPYRDLGPQIDGGAGPTCQLVRPSTLVLCKVSHLLSSRHRGLGIMTSSSLPALPACPASSGVFRHDGLEVEHCGVRN